jgi:uncharacterized protein YcfJ
MHARLINQCFTAAVIVCCSFNASAGRDNRNSNSHTDYAQVIDSRPIYRSVSRQRPKQQCHIENVAYQERNPYYQPASNYRSATPMLLGGVIGGAIGHKAGHHKKAKNAGAVIGALLGGSIGRDLYSKSRRNHHQNQQAQTITRYRDQEVCHTRQHTEYEEVLEGYDVSYQYRGRTYHSRMKRDPGHQIRIAINVRPID